MRLQQHARLWWIICCFLHIAPGNNEISKVLAAEQQQSCTNQMPDVNDRNGGDHPNRIVRENLLTGNPATEWDINGAGDPTIQGFATEISANLGQTIDFKISTKSNKYRADIYRLGYYNGMGARHVATVRPDPSLDLPQKQPDCYYDPTTHLVDCENWAVSVSWQVPLNVTSGLFIARLVREEDDEDDPPQKNWRADNSQIHWDKRFSQPQETQDPMAKPQPLGKHAYGLAGRGKLANALKEPRASHVYFVIRDDHRQPNADILIQTMDTTWQAYNCWGSINTYGFPCDNPDLHAGSPQYQTKYYANSHANKTTSEPQQEPPRAYRTSLNRPLATRAYRAVNAPLNAEYPLIRWVERNGYDVTYWSGVDTHRFGQRLVSSSGNSPCRLFISQSHDEYWSKEQREHVTAARNGGIHLAFFSGNDMYWKIRWEDNYRTMIVYKDSQETQQLDPVEWTGTWRDDRPINTFGALPENELIGTIFTVNAWRNDALEIPAKYSKHRIWKHTKVAESQGKKIVLLAGLLGHEWNEDIDNGFRPPGLQRLSETTVDNVQYLMDQGSIFDSGTATHHLVMYRHPGSRSLVFGAGTCQWAWGLDNEHDSAMGVRPDIANAYNIRIGKDQHGPDRTVQQATVNLFADCHIFAATLQEDLVPSLPSDDSVPPWSNITECAAVFDQKGVESKGWLTRCKGFASDVTAHHGDILGVVAAVEVAIATFPIPTDSLIWHPATIEKLNATTTFTYTFPLSSFHENATDTVLYVYSRAVDDSGNLENPLEKQSFGPLHLSADTSRQM